MARSFTDAHWDAIEARLEAEFHLPKGGMRSLRTKGERSNSNQVSPVGARTVYQIMPATRKLFSKTYGVDAYADDDGASAARVAALHLRDDMTKYGSWDAAVTRYHGGPDKSKWGPRTRAYTKRVTGQDVAGNGYTNDGNPDQPIKDFTGDWLHRRPADAASMKKPAKETSEAKRLRLLKASSGMDSLYTADGVDNTDVGTAAIRDQQIGLAEQSAEDAKITPWDRLAASWQDNTLTASIIRHMDEERHKPEPGFVDYYMKNRDEIEKEYGEDEIGQLREATSLEHLNVIRGDIKSSRARQELYTGRGVTSTDAVLFSLVGGVADPVGIAAGEGVGKLFQLSGTGARALYAARRPIAGTTAAVGEFALGNVAVTGGMDLAGDYYTSKDYASAAGLGGTMALAMAPFHLRGGAPDRATADLFEREAANGRAEGMSLQDRAEAELGPGATQQDVAARAQAMDVEDRADIVRVALADQPDELKVLSADNTITADEGVRAQVEVQHGLDVLSDDGERATAAEMTARLARIAEANPIDKARLNPLTVNMGLQSTGVDLLRSDSVVLRGLGVILTEGTTGAAGRRRTAAMAQHVRERVYNGELRGYTDLYHLYRKEQGVGLMSEAWNGKQWKSFEREVFLELERRGDDTGYIPHENRLVREAADKMERGFDVMRVEQQHVGTVGHARLGETSKGYVPHRIDGRKLAVLTNGERRAVAAEYSRQFQANEGFDKKFSDKLANKYIEQAVRRAKGGADVPMNLHSPDAADMVEDAIRAMGLPPEDLDKLLGKFSRGGAGHTKKRLKLNLDADIGDGRKLVDLYNTSVSDLYRGYARRVSGEVALAQFGIMGRKGLNVLRAAADATGATTNDLRAFDQVAAEFLNTPFGEHNHAFMDNLRIATSLSRLGGMGFTQLGEYANGIIALGVHRVFGAMGDMPRLVQEVRAIHKGGGTPNPILASLDQLGGHVGLDEFTNTRLFDVPDASIQMYGNEQVGVVGRFLRAGGNMQALLSGHRMILGVQVRGMSEQIVRKAMHYVRNGLEDKALDDMGINATLRARLRENLDKIATFEGDEGMTLYHGGPEGITTFSDAFDRSGKPKTIDSAGVYFTPSEAHAGKYGAKTYKVKVNPKKVLTLPSAEFPDISTGMIYRDEAKAIRAAGYDAVASSKGGELVVLDPSIIRHAADRSSGKLKNLDLLAGDLTGHEIMSIRDAIERGAGQIIQRTYIGETGKWAHDGMLKMLTQFRTFGITSIEKQWGRTKATHGALKSFAYTLGAMSFAAPIYIARVQSKMLGMSEQDAKDYGDKYLTPMGIALATMNYASSTGIASDVIDVGAGFAGGLGMELPDEVAARGRSRSGFVGGQIAPGVGLVNDIYSGATNLRTQDGEWNQSSVRKLEPAVPGSNLPYVQPLWGLLGPSD